MHPPEHYDACIQESQETLAQLHRQLAMMGRTQRGRRYIQERIASETRAIELFERDKQEAIK